MLNKKTNLISMKTIFPIIALIFIFQTIFSQNVIEKDFKSIFNKYGVDGCFVLYDQSKDESIRYNSSLCDTSYIPASTFKIANSVIALEEKLIKDTSDIIKWNGHKWPFDVWNKDQTLKSAVKYSCIWVYIEFAEQIGIDKYKEYIEAFNYGNKDLTGPANRFWLEGPFSISANEQIEFLKDFYNYKLPVAKQSIDIVKSVIILEQTDNYVFSGKTGTGTLNENEDIMWLVGYIEKENKPYFYALNFKTNDFGKTKQARYDITKDILRELKLIE